MIIVSFVVFIISIFVIIRNEWVKHKRLQLIDKGINDYRNYISYDQMMFRFWCWNVEKMRKKNKNGKQSITSQRH